MEITDQFFAFGFVSALAVVFIIWLIYKYFKWVDRVNVKIDVHNRRLNYEEERTDILETRVKVLEHSRINNTDHNEEGLGSINPSEADTE